jgi:hypothetical protein
MSLDSREVTGSARSLSAGAQRMSCRVSPPPFHNLPKDPDLTPTLLNHASLKLKSLSLRMGYLMTRTPLLYLVLGWT